ALVWDVSAISRAARARQGELKAGQVEALWADLAGADAARAYQAVLALAAAPRQAVPFLKERLRPVMALDARQEAQAARWIGELDSGRFAVRQKAAQALEGLGESARPALLKALAGRPSVEVRQRIERLLGLLETWPPERVRLARALEV